MGFELQVPPLSTMLIADMTPLAQTADAAQAKIREYAVKADEQLNSVGKAVAAQVARVNAIELKPLRPAIGGTESDVREQVGQYIRQMNAAARQQAVEIEVKTRLFGDPAAEAQKVADAARAELMRVTEIQGANSKGAPELNAAIEEAAADAAEKAGQAIVKTQQAAARGVAANAGGGGSGGGGGGFLDDLSENLSIRNSTFGRVTRLLAGGGVIGGLGLAAAELDRVANDAEKFAIGMSKGGDAARESVATFLTSLPVVGQLGDAGAKFLAITSGEAVYVAQIKEATEWQEHHTQTIRELKDVTDGYLKSASAGIASIRDEITAMGLSGLQKTFFQVGVETKGSLANVADDLASKLKDAALVNAQSDVNTAKQKLDDLHAQLSATNEKVQVSAGPVGGLITNPEFASLQSQIANWQDKFNKAKDSLDAKAKIQSAAADSVIAINDRDLAKRLEAIGGAAKTFADGFSAAWDRAKESALSDAQAIQKPFDELQQRIDTFSLTAGQRSLFDFKATFPDAGDAAFLQMKQLGDQFDSLQKNKDLSEQAKAFAQSLETPLQKYRDVLAKIDQLRTHLTVDQIDVAQTQAGEEYLSSLRSQQQRQPDFAPAVRAGSADQARLQFSAASDQRRQQYEQQALDLAKQQVDQTTKVADALGDVAVFDIEGAY